VTKAITQPEIHPDTERLSAFAEQALSERERSEVLSHLAVCGRCRQIVTLAQATPAEIAVEASAPEMIQMRRAWWKEWRLALAPVAALAMTAALAVYFHEQRVRRPAQMAQANPSAMMQNAEAPANPSQGERPAPPPQLASPNATREKRQPKPEHPDAGAPQRTPEMAMAPASPQPPAVMDRPAEAQLQPPLPPTPPPVANSGFLAGREPATYQPPAESEWQAEKKAQERDKLLANPGSGERLAAKSAQEPQDGGGGAPASSAQVQVTAAAPEFETQSAPMTGLLRGSQSSGLISVHRMSAVQLPSGLPVVSIASSGGRMLAIDKAGALFLSEDSGTTWKRITQQWTGRAIEVRRQPTEKAGADQAPEPKAKTKGNAPVAAASATLPTPVFEIVNDQGKVWFSADGVSWTAK